MIKQGAPVEGELVKLLYHEPGAQGQTSPFDRALMNVASTGNLRLVSPYLGVDYLARLVRQAQHWLLISDVEEWLRSLSPRARGSAWSFIRDNQVRIRHCADVHAKTAIGDQSAVLGSANFTAKGILGRSELGVHVSEQRLVNELQVWFHDLWNASAPIVVDEGNAYIAWLESQAPAAGVLGRVRISGDRSRVRATFFADTGQDDRPTNGLEDGVFSVAHIAQELFNQELSEAVANATVIAAAIATMANRGSFGLRDVVATLKRNGARISTREVFTCLVTRTANFRGTVFDADTTNELILAQGTFAQSTRQPVVAALHPFDVQLCAIFKCITTRARTADGELLAQMAEACGVTELTIDQYLGQLERSGVLDYFDRPGELGQLKLARDFDWTVGRFAIFVNAKALSQELWADVAARQQGEVSSERVADSQRWDSNKHVIVEILDNDEYLVDDETFSETFGALERRTWAAAEARALELHEKLDYVMAEVLRRIVERGNIKGKSIQHIARGVGADLSVGYLLVERVLRARASDGVPKVVIAERQRDSSWVVSVNEKLDWKSIAEYPLTTAMCERLVGATIGAQSTTGGLKD